MKKDPKLKDTPVNTRCLSADYQKWCQAFEKRRGGPITYGDLSKMPRGLIREIAEHGGKDLTPRVVQALGRHGGALALAQNAHLGPETSVAVVRVLLGCDPIFHSRVVSNYLERCRHPSAKAILLANSNGVVLEPSSWKLKGKDRMSLALASPGYSYLVKTCREVETILARGKGFEVYALGLKGTDADRLSLLQHPKMTGELYTRVLSAMQAPKAILEALGHPRAQEWVQARPGVATDILSKRRPQVVEARLEWMLTRAQRPLLYGYLYNAASNARLVTSVLARALDPNTENQLRALVRSPLPAPALVQILQHRYATYAVCRDIANVVPRRAMVTEALKQVPVPKCVWEEPKKAVASEADTA